MLQRSWAQQDNVMWSYRWWWWWWWLKSGCSPRQKRHCALVFCLFACLFWRFGRVTELLPVGQWFCESYHIVPEHWVFLSFGCNCWKIDLCDKYTDLLIKIKKKEKKPVIDVAVKCKWPGSLMIIVAMLYSFTIILSIFCKYSYTPVKLYLTFQPPFPVFSSSLRNSGELFSLVPTATV